jgi:spore germination cell wall hydrolase CwlJ-like protein
MLNRILLVLLSSLMMSSFAFAKSLSKEEKEIKCLALNIYFEARGEPQDGQFAVAAVTMNRVKSFKFPNTVCGVVWQRRQFSWTHDGKSDRPVERKAWQQAKKLAQLVYSKYLSFQEQNNGAWDLTQGALHYYASSIAKPYWAKNQVASLSIGRHTFVNM